MGAMWIVLAISPSRWSLNNAAASSVRENGRGRITILVSHRFSTVRKTDLIVLSMALNSWKQARTRKLLAKGGQYSELYGIQAASYR